MIAAGDFPRFFNELYGYKPFPWQTRLARQVIATGQWPDLLDLPTGTGKTAAIDVAVFHLAMEADKGEQRKAPLRILFVVDRRVIVDAAFERARHITESLQRARDEEGVLGRVARRLQRLTTADAPPLDVVRLRGGVPRERDWARSPVQPLVAASTVDQVGSRLLFRGYGVSPRMWPVHAALVGSDALWLLDEVHLSQPLEQTLDAIRKQHRKTDDGHGWWPSRLAPFGVAKLSATAKSSTADAFRLTEEDRSNDELRRRLAARKPVTLVQAGDDIGATLKKTALEFVGGGKVSTSSQSPAPVQRIAVIVNRVDRARDVFRRITKVVGDETDVVLLTGRIRALDRVRVMDKIADARSAPLRSALRRPLIVVATQTIEAGADLDFDALVTEIAPLDALRQRFGRLNRLGKRDESHGCIVYYKGRPTKAGRNRDNEWDRLGLLYGRAPYETLVWLRSLKSPLCFGVESLDGVLAKLTPEQYSNLLAPRENAPVMLPPYVRMWSTTWPPSYTAPEPALFLHGSSRPLDVHVVWRADADIDAADIDADKPGPGLEHLPPSSLEAVSVPIWAFRHWLGEDSVLADTADIPGAEPEDRGADTITRKLWRWRNGEWRRVSAESIRPGDTVVVPAAWGGADEWGWDPASGGEVLDIGAEAHYRQRLRGAVSVTKSSLRNRLRAAGQKDDTVGTTWRSIVDIIKRYGDALDGETARLELLDVDNLPVLWHLLFAGMEGRRPAIQFRNEADPTDGFVLYAHRRLPPGLLDESTVESELPAGPDSVTAYSFTESTDEPSSLMDHLQQVARWAGFFARRAGLAESLQRVVFLAALLHDVGKADPRFQANLRGFGVADDKALRLLQPLMSEQQTLLAKGMPSSRRRGRVRATPRHFRHEALSVALIRHHPMLDKFTTDERDLIAWLVGTHHGYGRPFFPPYEESSPDEIVSISVDGVRLEARVGDAPIRVDHGWLDLARRVEKRFSPWELARLEAIVRLADHAASAGRRLPEQSEPKSIVGVTS